MQTKLRSDAWEAALTAETRQELYHLTKPRAEGEPEDRPWLRDFDRDVLPYLSLQGIVAPGRSSWYRFLGRMREEEAAKTIISIETSKRIAQGIQEADIDYRLAADLMTSLSVDAAVKGNEVAAKILGDAAAKYAKASTAEEKLKIEAARQKTADAQLKLAREKFEAAEKRLNAVKDAVKTAKSKGGLTAETLKEIEEAAGLL